MLLKTFRIFKVNKFKNKNSKVIIVNLFEIINKIFHQLNQIDKIKITIDKNKKKKIAKILY